MSPAQRGGRGEEASAPVERHGQAGTGGSRAQVAHCVRNATHTVAVHCSHNQRTSTAYTLRAPACAAHTARMPLPVPTSRTTWWATGGCVSSWKAQPPAPKCGCPTAPPATRLALETGLVLVDCVIVRLHADLVLQHLLLVVQEPAGRAQLERHPQHPVQRLQGRHKRGASSWHVPICAEVVGEVALRDVLRLLGHGLLRGPA